MITITVTPAPPRKPLLEKEAIEIVMSALHGGADEDLGRAFRELKSQEACLRFIAAAAGSNRVEQAFQEAFHLTWTERGFRLREAVADDGLLLRALRALLPPYEGEAMTLFRGEQAVRFDAGRLGFGWSSSRKTALRYARGLCTTYEGGGVLLTAYAPRTAILTGPNDHSIKIDDFEYVVAPDALEDIRDIERFPFNDL